MNTLLDFLSGSYCLTIISNNFVINRINLNIILPLVNACIAYLSVLYSKEASACEIIVIIFTKKIY